MVFPGGQGGEHGYRFSFNHRVPTYYPPPRPLTLPGSGAPPRSRSDLGVTWSYRGRAAARREGIPEAPVGGEGGEGVMLWTHR